MLRYLSLLLTPLVVFYPTSSSLAQEGKQTFGELEKAALEEIRVTNTPGAVVAVIRNDKVVFVKGFGVLNVETHAPVTPDVLFRIGSATKTFTAATLVTLFEEGR